MKTFHTSILAGVLTLTAVGATVGDFTANGCFARWDQKCVTVGNDLFTLSYLAVSGMVRTASFQATGGLQWQRHAPDARRGDDLKVEAAAAKWSPVGAAGLRVTVEAAGQSTIIDLYPKMPGAIVRRPGVTECPVAHDLTRKWDGVYGVCDRLRKVFDSVDTIYFSANHIKATAITCLDQTDIRDNFIDVDERILMNYDWPFTIAANLLDCRDVLTGDGMVFVRLAPMPVSRPTAVDDFILNGEKGVSILANGYPVAELAYRGGEAGRRRALVAFQRSLRPYRPGRDGVLLSNTWGAGNRDSRINEEFLLKEIEAGAKLGVDVIQIDDGWQNGRTANSSKKANAGKAKVWNGFWDTDPDFWKEDRVRFPHGLDLLTKKAAEKGMRFGLWFGPDSSNDAANWEKDVACLLDYHQRLGIDYFKMDSLKLYSPLALGRNRQMFDRLLELSGGAMVFDLDVTAEVRPGFFGLMDIGTVFVENRGSRWKSYWPHHTLKNLWDLSLVIDPVRMRLEFNNPDTNHELYGEDPLSHAKYRPDALFATVMLASPLAWMELSDVSEKSVAAIAPLVKRWKLERERVHGGVTHPIGDRPDGVNWTGFATEVTDGTGGYVLVFRELNGEDTREFDLRDIFGNGSRFVSVIGGRGHALWNGGRVVVTIPETLDFVWLKLN